MARARLVGINHVALEVGDLDAALDFYGRWLTFELRGRVAGMAFLDAGDQFLALSEGRRQGPDDARHFGLVVDDRDAGRGAAPGGRGAPPPPRHFGLVVDDRDAVRAALSEAGIAPEPGRGLRVRDPWG